MNAIYTGNDGRRYRALGRCPVCELIAGSNFALDGDLRVYRLRPSPSPGDTPPAISMEAGQMVILLEPVKEGP